MLRRESLEHVKKGSGAPRSTAQRRFFRGGLPVFEPPWPPLLPFSHRHAAAATLQLGGDFLRSPLGRGFQHQLLCRGLHLLRG